jgi:hypothetical protein
MYARIEGDRVGPTSYSDYFIFDEIIAHRRSLAYRERGLDTIQGTGGYLANTTFTAQRVLDLSVSAKKAISDARAEFTKYGFANAKIKLKDAHPDNVQSSVSLEWIDTANENAFRRFTVYLLDLEKNNTKQADKIFLTELDRLDSQLTYYEKLAKQTIARNKKEDEKLEALKNFMLMSDDNFERHMDKIYGGEGI